MLAEKDPRDNKLAVSQQCALAAKKLHSNPRCTRKSITSTLRENIPPLCSVLLSHPECCSGLPRTGPKGDKELLQQGQLKFMEVSKGLEHFLYEERQ